MFSSFFDINNVMFTVMGYPMSYLEFFGTILNIATVWLCARRKIWNWPVGIVATMLFAVLFYQIQLYSDFFEQIYFIFTGIWGWWAWSRVSSSGVRGSTVSTMSLREIFAAGIFLAFGTLALGWFVGRIHVFFPVAFPEAASFPYLDAFTTVASFAAQILLVLRRVENWYLWIVIDVIGIWLYYEKDVKFVSLLYVVFLVLATGGLLSWRRELAQKVSVTPS